MYKIDNQFIILLVQFAGALVVARLAVNWALSRYKSEKLWERQLAAYTDLVTSLGEMRVITSKQFDDYACQREPSPEEEAHRNERYGSARKRLLEASALSQLILSREVASILKDFEEKLERASTGDTYFDHLDNKFGFLQETLERIISIARKRLGITTD